MENFYFKCMFWHASLGDYFEVLDEIGPLVARKKLKKSASCILEKNLGKI